MNNFGFSMRTFQIWQIAKVGPSLRSHALNSLGGLETLKSLVEKNTTKKIV